ncbi:hypothetical protein D0T92_07250 [Neisseria zalophi]|uniref:Uncharacterized protein n=1 Tax=Neisseria zalophi TaxID=640030 RepID=A0A5J6PVR6_9NEIS|nr:hypothetical protein D0T92_07250 [Neisseria zalophi]
MKLADNCLETALYHKWAALPKYWQSKYLLPTIWLTMDIKSIFRRLEYHVYKSRYRFKAV